VTGARFVIGGLIAAGGATLAIWSQATKLPACGQTNTGPCDPSPGGPAFNNGLTAVGAIVPVVGLGIVVTGS